MLASAAAATAGRFTLPVYEIYKAGGAPRWLDGLDLLGPLGLTVALIPHYDNAEGGRYDTRHCYLGERRLAVMERELGDDAAVLGVDEHTAVLIDLRTSDIEIRGRGGVTVRRSGTAWSCPRAPGCHVAELRDLVQGIRRAAGGGARRGRGPGRAAGPATRSPGRGAAELPCRRSWRRRSGGSRRRPAPRDADAMVGVILELETAIGQWEADMDEDQGTEQARALLRSLVGRARAGGPGRARRSQGPAAAGGGAAAGAAGHAARRGRLRRRRRHQGRAGRGRPRHQRHPGRHPLAADRDGLTRKPATTCERLTGHDIFMLTPG